MQETSMRTIEKRINPHSLRHLHFSLARKLIRNREEEKAISMNAGHSKPIISYQYGELSVTEREQIISKMNNRNDSPITEEDKKSILIAAKKILENRK